METTERHEFSATGPDGVRVRGDVRGPVGAPEVVLIHGFSQSSLSWDLQVGGTPGEQLRVVRYDLRGHGASEKPLDPRAYQGDSVWAEELTAVLDASGVERPVLCGWSYGARVVCEYLREVGWDRIAGLVLVGAVPSSDPSFLGPGLRHKVAMVSEDLAVNIDGTRNFLRCCFETQPSTDAFEEMLAYNMVVPPSVRAATGGRVLAIDDQAARCELPVLVAHGGSDQMVLPSAAHRTNEIFPNSRLSLYEGVGHLPFVEAPSRFDAELIGFCRSSS